MVNSENFTKRLQVIMEFYGLSAASFADKIDVGRSSISHLLSGRNKPSLDFVMKIVKAFPEVELYWLLNGKGSFPKTKNPNAKNEPSPALSPILEKSTVKPGEIEIPSEKKKISKVVIFYSDGSFEAYEN